MQAYQYTSLILLFYILSVFIIVYRHFVLLNFYMIDIYIVWFVFLHFCAKYKWINNKHNIV